MPNKQFIIIIIQDLGPPDGTVIVHCDAVPDNDDGTVFDDSLMMALLQELSQIGEVVLVRFVADTMWVTFRDGQCALEAAAKNSVYVSNLCKNVFLKMQQCLYCVLFNDEYKSTTNKNTTLLIFSLIEN